MLRNCIQQIRSKAHSIKSASRTFRIPERTLYRKLKIQNVEDIERSKCGHPTVFTAAEEKSFVHHLLLLAEFDIPITKDDLRICVRNYIISSGRVILMFAKHDMIPGKDWANAFVQRHPELSERLAENVKLARAEVNEKTLRDYITHLGKTIEGIPVENIYNFDETNLTDNPGKKRVLVKRGCKYPELIQNTSKVSTSIMTCGSASGELLPFYVVYKAGKVWSTWTENGPPGTKYDVSKSGWFDGTTFENWFFRILLPHAKRKVEWKVVICDNLSSHVNEKVIEKCRKHLIKFVFLPPNTTHSTQPLDVAFFAPTKRIWRRVLSEWKMTATGQRNATLPKSEFPRLLKTLWQELMKNAAANLQSGFSACGIVPLNVDVLLNKLPQKDDVDTMRVGEAFIKYVEEKRQQVIENAGPPKRKATNVVAGRNYWSDDSSLSGDSDDPNEEEAESGEEEAESGVEAPSQDEEGNSSESSVQPVLSNPSPPTPTVGDFILAEFMSVRTRSPVQYVGRVEESLAENKYSIIFLKQYNNRANEFVVPQIAPKEEVEDDAIISILPKPIERRGKFTFPYNVL